MSMTEETWLEMMELSTVLSILDFKNISPFQLWHGEPSNAPLCQDQAAMIKDLEAGALENYIRELTLNQEELVQKHDDVKEKEDYKHSQKGFDIKYIYFLQEPYAKEWKVYANK